MCDNTLINVFRCDSIKYKKLERVNIRGGQDFNEHETGRVAPFAFRHGIPVVIRNVRSGALLMHVRRSEE